MSLTNPELGNIVDRKTLVEVISHDGIEDLMKYNVIEPVQSTDKVYCLTSRGRDLACKRYLE